MFGSFLLIRRGTENPSATSNQINANVSDVSAFRNDLNPTEIPDFKLLEKGRRLTDENPRVVCSTPFNDQSAVINYLHGRACLQVGEFESADSFLNKAEKQLSEQRNVDFETLRVEVAFADAALQVMMSKFPGSAKMLADLINENKLDIKRAPQSSALTTEIPRDTGIANLNDDLTPTEINEFISYERLRRAFDDKPNFALKETVQPLSSVDFYLRGRALLQIGSYEEALEAFKTAQEMLPDAQDINRNSLRVDMAIAMAAVSRMAFNPNAKKMLSELIQEKRRG
jgi:tetratricopeptide (TPR) repeat protein